MRRILLGLLLAAALLHGEAYAAQGVFQYTRVSTNATTVVRSGAGVLFSVVINTRGTAANTATVFDNTAASGPIIAVIDTTAAVGTLLYNVQVRTGVTVVTATGTAPDLTVVTD